MMNRFGFFTLFLVIILHLMEVKAQVSTPAIFAKGGGFEADTIITYKEVDNTTLSLYCFYPHNYKAGDVRPAIVFYFGGGWKGGHVSQFYPQSKYLASRGMIAICAQYRIGRHGAEPWQCVEDAKSAVRYIRKNAQQLGINPNKLAAAGGSAGGHLAAATATIKAFDAASDDLSVSAIPNALVLFNPVYDNGPEGYGFERVKAYYQSFSPIDNLDGTQPPTLVLMGDKDKHTAISTCELYEQRMKINGNVCKTVIYKGQKHGFFNLHKTKDKTYFMATTKEMDSFLVEHGFLNSDSTIGEWFKNQEK